MPAIWYTLTLMWCQRKVHYWPFYAENQQWTASPHREILMSDLGISICCWHESVEEAVENLQLASKIKYFTLREESPQYWSTHTHHFSDVIIGMMASQITGVLIVCWAVCPGADQRKHQSSTSLAFVRGIHRWPVDSPHKGRNVEMWWRRHAQPHMLQSA